MPDELIVAVEAPVGILALNWRIQAAYAIARGLVYTAVGAANAKSERR